MLLVAECSGWCPVDRGNVRLLRPTDPILLQGCNYATTLQIRWLGTASYVIQLGDVSVLVDPFASHQGRLRVLSVIPLQSNLPHLQRTFRNVPKPRAIFIAHSHWDHLMDVFPLIRLKGWKSVPLYGSVTTKYILAGGLVTNSALDRCISHRCVTALRCESE